MPVEEWSSGDTGSMTTAETPRSVKRVLDDAVDEYGEKTVSESELHVVVEFEESSGNREHVQEFVIDGRPDDYELNRSGSEVTPLSSAPREDVVSTVINAVRSLTSKENWCFAGLTSSHD